MNISRDIQMKNLEPGKALFSSYPSCQKFHRTCSITKVISALGPSLKMLTRILYIFIHIFLKIT